MTQIGQRFREGAIVFLFWIGLPGRRKRKENIEDDGTHPEPMKRFHHLGIQPPRPGPAPERSHTAVVYIDMNEPTVLTQRTAELMHFVADPVVELGDIRGKSEMDEADNK